MKINDFRGYLTHSSAKKEALVPRASKEPAGSQGVIQMHAFEKLANPCLVQKPLKLDTGHQHKNFHVQQFARASNVASKNYNIDFLITICVRYLLCRNFGDVGILLMCQQPFY